MSINQSIGNTTWHTYIIIVTRVHTTKLPVNLRGVSFLKTTTVVDLWLPREQGEEGSAGSLGIADAN